MEVRASTYTASKLGALAMRRTYKGQRVGEGGPGRGHVRFKIAHDGIEEWKRRCGTEVWVGLSEEVDLKGDLYSQGECGLHFFGRRGDYRNEFLKRGGARAIRWSIRRNASGHATASELPSSCNIPVSFFFSRDSHGACTRCAKSEAKCLQSTYAHLSGKIIVGQAIVSYPSRPILCRSATESVARDGTPPCPHHFRAPSPRAAPSGLLMSSAPTTRSRTLLFLSYRDSRASSSTSHHKYALDNDGDENERLIDTPKDHIAIDVGLPPKWSGNLRR